MPNKLTQESTKLRDWLMPIAALVFSLFATTSYADKLLVISRQLDSYERVAHQIQDRLKTPAKVITLSEFELTEFDTTGYQTIVAIGSKSGDILFDRIPAEKNLIICFLPRQTYQALLEKYKDHPRKLDRKVSAIFFDQPYTRQLALTRLVAPKAKKVATALGPHSQKDLKILTEAASKQSIDLTYETLQDDDNPIHKLQPLIRDADLFLSLPDKSVFNRTTAKWILYISFRQRIPLIGFSKKYVEAGAIAAVHSTPEQIGQHTAEFIIDYASNKQLPEPEYPKYFTVSTNNTAANSLRIRLPSEEELTSKLMEQER
ncbi:ABC transporter substrate binding protein [uncultured Neptuniibacter sp.]|uniref:ABC transporter substrate-binding protein n=1 Tax=uncultured Neptuniibacter sp. TaxID=502143 RepID=UPI0026345847|nr:ABC transporter substrate binding protein [uncultured Neptuniibacter sp.]